MRFGFHLFMVDPAEFLDIARTADEWGWDSLQVADAPFFPEVTSAPYPYTPDGERFWPLDLPVLDPWVAITAMATVTKRIRFVHLRAQAGHPPASAGGQELCARWQRSPTTASPWA